MNKNIKNIIVVILTLAIAYVVFKLLKAVIFAVFVAVALLIAYGFVNRAINGKKEENNKGW